MKKLLLIGAGHTNAQVLRAWVDEPLSDVEVVVVAPSTRAPYSGMVPGWLSGVYAFEEICIDFFALARAAGAKLIVDELASLDPDRRIVRLAGGKELGYDILCLNVGSTLNPPAVSDTLLLPLRPLGRLRSAWETLLSTIERDARTTPLTVTAVGGGAAGVEALLACLARLRAKQPGRVIRGQLVTRGASLLPGLAPRAVGGARRALERAGVTVHLATEISEEIAKSSDLILWATGAEAHAWQRDSGLAVSERGFIRVDSHLRSVSHRDVFAVGDCAEWADPLPKAGVYAVRMGPALVQNVRAALEGKADRLKQFEPQRNFLVLLATGDLKAIASRGRWAAHGWLLGRALWLWKDRIDRKFLSLFTVASAGDEEHRPADVFTTAEPSRSADG
jgi:pyridine nucleotide-disulfide oxidoreductase family protein